MLRCAPGGTVEAGSTTRLLSEVHEGLNADEARVATFATELAIHPLWLAAHRGVATAAVSARLREPAFLREQLSPATVEQFHQRIRRAGADPVHYTLVPAHPWQWRERISRAFATPLHNRELIVLGDDPHTHLAQQSIRTLACRDVPGRAYLKLSLSIVNTSTSRVLAPHTVGNAPRISDWLQEVLAGDPYLRDELRLILLGEVMDVAVDPAPVSELVYEDTYGALACIWRENLHPHLAPEEQAVPFTGLTARTRRHPAGGPVGARLEHAALRRGAGRGSRPPPRAPAAAARHRARGTRTERDSRALRRPPETAGGEGLP